MNTLYILAHYRELGFVSHSWHGFSCLNELNINIPSLPWYSQKVITKIILKEVMVNLSEIDGMLKRKLKHKRKG